MRLSVLITALYLVVGAVAGGYQGALERVMLYYAYQIDGLNPEERRSIGWRCMEWNDGACDRWRQFTNCDTGPGGRCNFNQFFRNMGYGVNGNPEIVPGDDQNARTLDIEKTAVAYYDYVRRNTDAGRVPNYVPYHVMKNAGIDYNAFIGKLGDLVQQTANSKKTPSNAWMFDEFHKTVKAINVARAGDHGPFAITEANSKLGNQWVVTRNVGSNPALKPEYKNVDWFDNTKKPWSEVDWAATQAKMERAGIKDADQKVTAARNAIYGNGGEAANHLAVMQSFQNMETKITNCKR
ncbi:hypothetical protein B0I35DRAFT_407983 [Stachybotrys elegans]|uniref:Uncharacterized protein n=1 Tax=Stachybotrys elegans TaxID=80388 RepID=A0A8K0SU41_9HYPO|nr:hypothetical protein B0I35DRAFT_407983 [Stachybotrys elegans]